MTNEVLGAKLDAVGQRVEKVELKVDSLHNSYVPHDIFELRLKELEGQIAGINLSIQKLYNRRTIQTFLTGTLSAAAGIILALLVEFYISHVGSKR